MVVTTAAGLVAAAGVLAADRNAAGAADNYGDAPADGNMSGAHLNAPVVAASGW